MSDKQQLLSWTCPDHPNAKVLHTWDQVHSALNGYPAGIGFPKNHRFECNECGQELAAHKNESAAKLT